jgi:hypothetical protein
MDYLGSWEARRSIGKALFGQGMVSVCVCVCVVCPHTMCEVGNEGLGHYFRWWLTPNLCVVGPDGPVSGTVACVVSGQL